MERSKSSSGRGGKSKTPQFPADLYALGSKSSGETKQRSGPHPPSKVGTSHGVDRERKREGTILAAVPSKKSKLSSTLLGRGPPTGSSSSGSSTTDTWEALALECDPSDLVATVLEAVDADDSDKMVGYICGAIKLLRSQRQKPDAVTYMNLGYLAKLKKHLFTNDYVINALCSLLKRESGPSSFKSLTVKTNPILYYLVINIFITVFQDTKRWPEMFIKIYLDDACGDRSWVDNELCKNFVDNIVISLNTKPVTVQLPEPAGRPEQPEDDVPELRMNFMDQIEPVPPMPRYRWNKEGIETIVLENVKEQLARRQSSVDLINRNFLKMLTSLCGLSEVRLIIASRLEAWLQNPKLMRPAQELLMSLCVNCTAHSIKDVEIISNLIKMRLKTKALSNYYLQCIKELVSAHGDNLNTVLKHTIYNELSTSRNPNNMAMLSVMFQHDPDRAAQILADIFQELLLSRDDYLRPLRALLRELARVLRSELRLQEFCRGLMGRTEPLSRDTDSTRAFISTIDLISLCLFLAAMPHARSDKKDLGQLEKMQMAIANIQSDCVWWLQEAALGIYKPSSADFTHALQKVLLLEPAEQYYKIDAWPPEQDRTLFMRMASEVPVLESTLITILAIGISKELPLSPAEAFELTEQIVKRAASITNPIIPVLRVEKSKILDLVFNLSTYRHPDNIELPSGYTPPSLAISSLYWKGWTLLLILSAHNPTKFGALAWDKYPTLRILMEMCITSHFVFPPGFDDLQLLNHEKQNILQFESYLAAASTKIEITEETSLLVPQLISLDPFGPPRRPPPASLEAIKSLNIPLRLGHLLCRSRAPDFLLDIIHRQGASQSMPWLADLVHNSDGALNHLPVQCLCEFLLTTGHKQEGIYQQLLAHLRSILTDPNQDPSLPCDVLDYFLRRLSSPTNRGLAINGLKLVLSPLFEEGNEVEKTKFEEKKDDPSWLMKQLPTLPHFIAARPQIIDSLRSACQVENEPDLITSYLCFLAEHGVSDLTEMADLVLDMAQLIVERSTIMSSILSPVDCPNPAIEAFLTIFFTYLTKAREPRKEKYTWSESQDQVLVSWPSGEECTVHILVVHAMVILLTYGPQSVSMWTHQDQYYHLLDTWFPEDYRNTPKGFLVDTSEEALLIPDWLKLRMIRSHVPRLVEAALQDLEISQLILFIQSFGIPIASMSKLLSTLDEAVMTDRAAVGEAVIDKQYMIQLVEVQHKRGAIGGETFIRVLDLQEPVRSVPMEVDTVIVKKEKVERRVRPEPVYLSDEEGIAALERIFNPANDSFEQKSAKIAFTHLQRTLVHEIKAQDGALKNRSFLKEVMRYLLKRVAIDKFFVHHIIAKPQFSCPLFRLLTTLHPHSTSLVILAKAIFECEFPNAKPKALMDLLQQYISKQETSMELEQKVKVDISTDENMNALTKTMEKLMVFPKSEAGHLVDKLVKLEPEILGSLMDMQMKLLFSSRNIGTLQCRPYLLTLLTHHASWKTLSSCVEILLREESLHKYDPTPVLDFLKALTCNPKLWQGREKHTAKHYKPENVLNLNLDQLKCMTDYIVAEGIQLENDKVSSCRTSINNRLSFLEHCIKATDIHFASNIAKHLMERGSSFSTPRDESRMCHQLLVQLYMRIPSLISHLKESEIMKIFSKYAIISVADTSTLDVLSHNLLTALASTPNNKEWPKRAVELELAVRKMAASHPLLVLRQLPLIASSLKGRVDLDWNVLKFRNHLLLFQQISTLLDLLQPLIFQAEYADPLHKIIDLYFELFQNHGREGGSAVGTLITQIVIFLHAYIKKNSKQAQAYLKVQAEAISELQSEFPIMGTLCVVVSNLKGSHEVILTPSTIADQPNPQWESKVAQLHKDMNDPIASLSFIDYNSSKRPGLITPIFSTICSFLSSPVSQIRNSASSIVVRYIKHYPRSAKEALPVLMDCLDSRNPDIVSSVLEKVPEVVVCSQEIALPLLQKVFSLGINKNINTFTCIAKAISLLNQQSGC